MEIPTAAMVSGALAWGLDLNNAASSSGHAAVGQTKALLYIPSCNKRERQREK